MSESAGAHDAYQRLLARPEVRALAARFGLDGQVRYEFVNARRSFHGKAAVVAGQPLVRLPDNPRPEPYLLLTLLHEWAHLLAQGKDRSRQSQPVLWRPGGKGKRKRRRQAEANLLPHGKEWREQYHALASAAVEADLFPDNEEEVLRHAAAGEARTQRARLHALEEETPSPSIDSSHPAPQLRVGDAVRFADRQGRILAGTVVRVNQRTYTVVLRDGIHSYRVPMDYPLIAREGEPIPQRPEVSWRPGMTVAFTDPAGQSRKGVVLRVNQMSLTVDADDGYRYRVGKAQAEPQPGEKAR